MAGDLALVMVSTALSSTCALASAGLAWCWGSGLGGASGDGDTGNHERGTPSRVIGERPFVDIAVGGAKACAIDAAGQAWCWGTGKSGELGDGNTSEHSTGTPTRVVGNHTFTTINAGRYGTPAHVDTGGQAWCWGNG